MKIKSPKSMFDHLDKYIVGQKAIKKSLSNLYFLHGLRCLVHKHTGEDYKKSIGLFYGPTGCGKTYSVSTLAKAAGLPYYKVNAKDITLPGFKGMNLNEHVQDYVNKYAKSPLKDSIEYGIFHIDEFDKIMGHGKSDSTINEWDNNLQYNLLSFIEGDTVSFGGTMPSGMPRKKVDGAGFRSHNLFIVLTGSFSCLESEMKADADLTLIGIGPSKKSEVNKTIQTQLMEAGMVKELAGRITVVEKVEKLTKEQFKEAFLDKEESIYKQYEFLLSSLLDFKLSKKEIDGIIQDAIDSDIGARGLHFSLEKAVEELVFNCKTGIPEVDDAIELSTDEEDEDEGGV